LVFVASLPTMQH